MTKIPTPPKTPLSEQRLMQRKLKRLREDLEDILDYVLILEARVSDMGGRGHTPKEVRALLGLEK